MRTLFLLALFTACAKGDDTDATTDSGSADTGNGNMGVPDIVPTAGTWEVFEVTVIDDGCELDDNEPAEDGEPETEWILADNGDGNYTVEVADFLAPWTCEIQGMDLVCETQTYTQSLETSGMMAEITQEFPFGMHFTDSKSSTATWGVSMTCTGDDCGDLDTRFPCSSSFSATAIFAAE